MTSISFGQGFTLTLVLSSQVKAYTYQTLGCNFGLTITHIFAPFMVFFFVSGKGPLLFVKQRLQLSKRSLLTEREIQITSSTIVVSKFRIWVVGCENNCQGRNVLTGEGGAMMKRTEVVSLAQMPQSFRQFVFSFNVSFN